MSARISYNRLSRVAWISDERGDTVARRVADRGERLVDVAGRLLTAHGYVRIGEYLLAGNVSPVREASIRACRTPRVAEPRATGLG